MAKNSPSPFPESNLAHLGRTAEVVIVKKLRAFTLPGLNETESESKTFQRNFFEFLGGNGLLLPCKQLDLKWQNPDVASSFGVLGAALSFPLYNHYFVSATAAKGTTDSVASPIKGNADVISARATVSTEGRGSCTVVLSSQQDKYIFKRNPFKAGQSLFEPNDMVFVNLPDMDGNLRRVFTGFVSGISVQKVLGDTLKTTVVLECEDMLKQLTQSRTAVKPSLAPSMSDGKTLPGLENDFSGRLPHDIMSEVLALACADFYTVTGFYDKLFEIRDSSFFDETQAQINEFQLLKSLTALPQPPAPSFDFNTLQPNPAPPISFEASKPFLATAGSATSIAASVTPPILIDPQSSKQQSTQIPAKVYGFRRARKDASQASTSIDKSVKSFAPLQKADMDDLAFVISGTAQPAFQLAFSGSASLYFADFKSGLALCKQVADDLNYEFFANQNGVIIFRPLNVSLPANFINGAKPIPTAKLRTANGRVGSEYWLEDNLMGGRPSFIDSDVDIYTFAYVGADYQISLGGNQFFKGIAFDLPKFLKFGARTAPLITKLNLLNDDACAVYANAYLSRLNAAYSSAAIQYTGDSRLQAGNPCFVKSRNTIYYISSITHTFEAGQSYTVDLTLKYGRRPIAAGPGLVLSARTLVSTDLGLANLTKSMDLSQVLGRLNSGGATIMAEYISANQVDLTFQGFIWEPLMQLDFESLYASLSEQQAFNATKELVENAGFNSPAWVNMLNAAKRGNPALTGQRLNDLTAGNILTGQWGLTA